MSQYFYLQSGSAGMSSSQSPAVLIMNSNDRRTTLSGATASVNLVANTNNILATNTANGTAIVWISPPVASSFTLSGSVTCSIWGQESNANDNTTMAFRLWHKSGSASFDGSGAETAMMTQISASTVEFGTTPSQRFAQSVLTNTAFKKDDRILLRVYVNSGSGATFGSITAGTTTFFYGGDVSGSNGDSLLFFTQDIPLKQKVTSTLSNL